MLLRKSFLTLLISGALFGTIIGQVDQDYRLPAGLDLEDDNGYENVEKLPDDGAKAALPPGVDLSRYAPIPRHQRDIESCVGWSLSYGVMTIEYAKRNGWRDRYLITENAFSPTFIYSQLAKRQECGPSKLSEALEFLKEIGNIPAGDFDGTIETCSYELSPEVEALANQYRITSYLRLFDQGDPDKRKVYKAKQALAARKPIVIGMKINNNFMGLKAGARIWYPAIGGDSDPPFMGHAMTVIGFNDRNNTFKLLNSWGPKWGNRGTIEIKYQDFGKYCKYGYIINIQDEDLPQTSSDGIDAEQEIYAASDPNDPTFINSEPEEVIEEAPRRERPAPTRDQPNRDRPSTQRQSEDRPESSSRPPQRKRPLRKMAANFKFNYLHENDVSNPLFLESEVKLYRDYYQLTKLDWETGQRFQMVTRTRTNKEFMYVFSLDPDGEVMIHWPRKASLHPRFEGQNESAFILHKESTVYFPGKERVFTLKEPGKHTMIVLFSKKPLKDFKRICHVMKGHNEFPGRKLDELLGKRKVPWSDINYEDKSMGFEVLTRSGGYVVPLILEAHKR